VFGGALPEGALDALKGELRWLGARLGEARDWDVFRSESLPAIARGLAGICDAAALDELARAASLLGERAGRGARLAWRSKRTSLLLLALGRASVGGGFVAASEAMRGPILPYSAALLTRRLERVLRLGKKARGAPEAARLHALRIGVKKLRYAVEFFGSLHRSTGKPFQQFRDRLVALQDCLGRVCDAAQMVKRVREAVPASTSLIDIVQGWSACIVHTERRRFDALWKELKRSPRFW
jgi:CHAD domain-containing protein